MQRRALPVQGYELKPRGFFLKSGTVEIYTGNTLDVLRRLPANKFQCVVTSPPYLGLRDYGTATWDGGDPACNHEPDQSWIDHNFNAKSSFGGGATTQSAAAKGRWYRPDGSCRCGAIRVDQQIGLESSPTEYVDKLVKVFREVRRVLRDDGVVFLNLGDSFASQGGTGQTRNWDGRSKTHETQSLRRTITGGIKPKDLVGIPWRVAFALQADGWWLRNDIIWHKPNPMPESVTDRCTSSHEYVFLLTKRSTYFWDQEAVKEKGVIPAGTRGAKGSVERAEQFGVNSRPPEYIEYDGFRNIRDVWTINTEVYEGSHFATFPTKLVDTCIKAGTSEHGCCSTCGAPWERVIENSGVDHDRNLVVNTPKALAGVNRVHRLSGSNYVHARVPTDRWQPTCKCRVNNPVPCSVLDPFGGSGTTGMVAGLLARHATIIDLNPEYVQMARRRITNADVPVVLK